MVLAALICLPVLSVLAGEWTYDSGSATLSHDTSGWELRASANGTNLTVTAVRQLPDTPSALSLIDPIPGYTLVSIGNSAFYNCISLTFITIGNSVTNIGDEAFRACTSLTSITIPDSITNICDNAFEGCTRSDGRKHSRQRHKHR